MKDQLNFESSLRRIEVFRGGKWQNGGSSNTQYREFCMDWVDRSQNYKGVYGIILQLLQGFHLDNFPVKTLKLGLVAFHSLTFQLKCWNFQSNQLNNLVLYSVLFHFGHICRQIQCAVYILYSKISIDPGILKIRHSHRFVAVVIQFLIPIIRNSPSALRFLQLAIAFSSDQYSNSTLHQSPGSSDSHKRIHACGGKSHNLRKLMSVQRIRTFLAR